MRPLEDSMNTGTFFHAGCPVCVSAEHQFIGALDPAKYAIEIVHLGEDRARIVEAETVGVRSVPALVLDGHVFHINFGASMEDVKAPA
jgi:glutaredoxin